MPESDFVRVKDYIERLKEGSLEKIEVFVFETEITDKVTRSKIHMFFKNETSIFETDTLQGSQKLIRVFLKHALSSNKRRKLNIVERKPEG